MAKITTLAEAIAAIEDQEARITDLEKHNSLLLNMGASGGAEALRTHITETKVKWKASADKVK
jgi:hypothetical protein